MKRHLSSAVLIAALLASSAAYAGQQTVTLAVKNMTCAACPLIVRKAMDAGYPASPVGPDR